MAVGTVEKTSLIPSERRLQSPTRSEHDQSGYTGNYRGLDFLPLPPRITPLSSVYFEERANFMTDGESRGRCRSLASQVTGQMTPRLRKTKWCVTTTLDLVMLPVSTSPFRLNDNRSGKLWIRLITHPISFCCVLSIDLAAQLKHKSSFVALMKEKHGSNDFVFVDVVVPSRR